MTTTNPKLINGFMRRADQILECDSEGIVVKVMQFASVNKAKAYNRTKLSGRAMREEKITAYRMAGEPERQDMRAWSLNS